MACTDTEGQPLKSGRGNVDDDLLEMQQEMLAAGADPELIARANAAQEPPVSLAEALRNSAVRNVISDAIDVAVAMSPTSLEKIGLPTIGIALSVCGGAANAIAFAKYKMYVSHVSGVSTSIGLRLEEQQKGDLPTPAEILFYFICGATLAGLIIPKVTLKMGHARYDVVLFLVAAMELVCWCQELSYPEMLAAAMGLQNAMITSWSGAALRTTHMTGTATDLGSSLGRICSRFFRACWSSESYKEQDWNAHAVDQQKLFLMCCLQFAFVAGGIAGAAAFRMSEMHALLLPAGLTIILGTLHVIYCVVNRETIGLEQAAENHFIRALSGGSDKEKDGDRRDLQVVRTEGNTERTQQFIRQLSGGSDKADRVEKFVRQLSSRVNDH
mmetsp:Transcript_109062/g.274421  ORF Transcript_109062/g.274421 Transcript_109062/m.274421 type:complete len:385 (+) Transcript_109062:133-1287(+)